jgi:hypothetical protein
VSGGNVVVQVINGLTLVMAIQQTVSLVAKVVKEAKTGISVSQALKNVSQATNAGAKAAVIGVIVQTVFAWGAFIAFIAIEGTSNSLAVNDAVASAFAATITAVILAVISALPVIGQIFAVINALADALAALACGIKFGDDIEKEANEA